MKKILLAGDSTVTDQTRSEPYDLAGYFCGWGQMLTRFLQPGVDVRNFAVSGFTTGDFRTSGQYDKLMAVMEEGDYAFFQFGHNDQKRPHLGADGGYPAALILKA
jgi:lysophospholipase L1-like esterase